MGDIPKQINGIFFSLSLDFLRSVAKNNPLKPVHILVLNNFSVFHYCVISTNYNKIHLNVIKLVIIQSIPVIVKQQSSSAQ
jgi:hypothetical protein